MKITQARLAPGIQQYFKKPFLEKWGLQDYTDADAGVIFLGIYCQRDFDLIRRHRGFAVVMYTNQVTYRDEMAALLSTGRYRSVAGKGFYSDMMKQQGLSHVQANIPIKDFSPYKPVPLGDRIYVYRGVNGNRGVSLGWGVVEAIQKEFGGLVTWTTQTPTDKLIKEYYEKSFVYLKPRPIGGCITMWEMGHMGRKTFGKGFDGVGCFEAFTDIGNLTDMLHRRSNMIGQTDHETAEATRREFIGEEWLDTEWWDTQVYVK